MVFFKYISFLSFFLLSSFTYGDDTKSNRIEVLVNENIITKYDIIQRLKINSILNRIEINDDNYNLLLNAVIDDLVVEKLKVIKIDEYKINFEKVELDQFENRFYSSSNYNEEDLKELFSINNIDYSYLKEIFEIDLKWQKLIYGLYYRVSSVTEQEVIDMVVKNPDINEEIARELLLQKQLELKSIKLIKDLKDEATIEYK